MQFSAALFNIAVSLAAPVGIFIYLLLRKRSLALPFTAGALTFLVSQVLTRIPLLGLISGQFWFIAFSTRWPALYALFLGLTAGLFEEIGRYIAMRLMHRHQNYPSGVVFGIGHGGFEAIVLVGINNLILLFTQYALLLSSPPLHIATAGIERLFTVFVHVGLSVMVMRSVERKRPLFLVLAILIHTVIDTIAVLMQQHGASIFAIEAVVALAGIALLVYTFWQKPKEDPAHV